MKEAKLTTQSTKILKLLKTEGKEMNLSQVSSSAEIDRGLAMINLNDLEHGGYVTSDLKQEKIGDRNFIIRYFSITERGLTYPTD